MTQPDANTAPMTDANQPDAEIDDDEEYSRDLHFDADDGRVPEGLNWNRRN